MSESNNKINAFEVSVRKEVDDEVGALILRAEQESSELINAVKDESLNYSFYKISSETRAIKAACRKRVSKQSFESRRAVLKKRSELIDDFFSTLAKKLGDFSEGPDYREFIKKELAEISAELPFYDGVKIYVKPRDLDKAELFGADSSRLEADKRIKLGGIAVFYPKEKVYFDRTLDKKLKKERESFINHEEIQL